MKFIASAASWFALALVLGCSSNRPKWDYGPFLAAAPRSILVLPPLDETIETGATYGTLAAVTEPLVEQGYYVFPVAVVDALMKENGLPTPHDMHGVSLEKLREVFDPDAVLYLTVTEWGTSYRVLSSVTKVSVRGSLVDAHSGNPIWAGGQTAAESSGSGGFGLVGALTNAVVSQVGNTASEYSRKVAIGACAKLVRDLRTGLPPGPYHPDYAERTAELREWSAERAPEPPAP